MGRSKDLSKRFKDKKLEKIVGKFKDISPIERLVIKSYIKKNGVYTRVAKDVGLTSRQVYKILAKPIVRRRLKKVFRKLGIDILTVIRVLKKVMMRTGDYHYDFNRLRAADMYLKLVQAYAPDQLNIKGGLTTTSKYEVRATLVKLIQVMKESDGERLPVESGFGIPRVGQDRQSGSGEANASER